MKTAVFQVVNTGLEGRDHFIEFSSLYEQERDDFYANSKNKNFCIKVDVVLDLALAGRQFMNKLNGNDKMILDLCLLYDCRKESLTFPYGDNNIKVYSPKQG